MTTSKLVIDNTKIVDVMSHQLVTMPVASSTAEVAKKMTGYKVSSVLLIDHNDKPAGIVTERDIVRQACSQDLPLMSFPAALLMSAPLIDIEASATMLTAVELMVKHHLRHLIVRDRKTGLRTAGILSIYDIMRHLTTQLKMNESQSSIFSLLSSLHIE